MKCLGEATYNFRLIVKDKHVYFCLNPNPHPFDWFSLNILPVKSLLILDYNTCRNCWLFCSGLGKNVNYPTFQRGLDTENVFVVVYPTAHTGIQSFHSAETRKLACASMKPNKQARVCTSGYLSSPLLQITILV